MAKRLEQQLPFLLDEFGESIIIDGIEKKALIRDVQDKFTYYDDKFIRTPYEISSGTIVTYNDEQWMLISQVDQNKKSYRGRIRRINKDINIVISESLYSFPGIIEGISFGIDDGRIMQLQAGKIQVTLSATEITHDLFVDIRFITMDNAWKITGIDKSKSGLIFLYCEKDLFGANDDREQEIADKDKIALWEIEIIEGNSQVSLGNSFTYVAIVKKNGTVVENIPLLWKSANDSIASVEDGEVHGVSLGITEIMVCMRDNPAITFTFSVEVMESVSEVITYSMWRSNLDGSGKTYSQFELPYGSERMYGVDKFINGVFTEENDSYTFELNPNGTETSKYTFTILDVYTVKIKANGFGSTIILMAASQESGEEIQQSILLKSVF